jgi:hypothetical protein
MAAEGLTVADLVERAGPANAAQHKLWLRQARYWAAHGVLPTEGRLHAGTGRHRRFSGETAFLAMLLFRLGTAGLPLSVIDSLAHAIRQELANPTESLFKIAWESAKGGQDEHLGIMFSDPGVTGKGPVMMGLVPMGKRLEDAPFKSLDLVPLHVVNLGAIFRAMSRS